VLRRHRELWYALLAAIVVTAIYALAYAQAGAFPKASGLVGHGIGIIGFLLMLAAETLYSVRKQRSDASWGSMGAWLRFHVFTGLVGPYMVLLHTSMRFQGLAGVAMLLTGIVVISGAVGRYIYTSVPRQVEDPELAQRIARQRKALATWYTVHVPLTWALFATAAVHMAGALYYATLQR
jgi:predicted ferric reductase